MSISNDSSQVELIASSDTTVTTPADIDVIPKDDLAITGRKNEYSIIGDGIYASVSAGPAPGWLTQIIDSVISSALGDAMSDLTNANANILRAISEIEVARNTYDVQINISETIDSVIASRLATLNASLGNTNNSVANIIELQTAFVTEDMAMALSADVINASLNTTGGVIKGAVDSLRYVMADLESTVATNYDQVMAEMGDISATVTQEMVAFVTDEGTAGARFKINLETVGVKDPDGNPSTLVGGLILESDGQAVSGGFDVDNFWLGRAGSNGQHPFAIQGNDIYFNGKVNFSSVTDVPQLGSTPEEVVDAINSGNTTTIDGGKITTRSIKAGQIELGSLTADEIDVGSLLANTLSVENGVISGSIQSTGYVEGSSGWKIDRNGSAVFNNTTVRGLFTGRLRAGSLRVLSELNNSEGPIIAEFFKPSADVPKEDTTYSLGQFILPYSSSSSLHNKITSLSGEISITVFGHITASNWSMQYAVDSDPWITLTDFTYIGGLGTSFQRMWAIRLSNIPNISTKQLIKFRFLRTATAGNISGNPHWLYSVSALAQCSNL